MSDEISKSKSEMKRMAHMNPQKIIEENMKLRGKLSRASVSYNATVEALVILIKALEDWSPRVAKEAIAKATKAMNEAAERNKL